ncbi:MAG: trypco2 family protein [Rhodocyclaceae bacterium]
MMMNLASGIELAEVIKHVSDQLIAADEHARERGYPVMQFDECEVELAVRVSGEGGAGVKILVFEAGAKGEIEHANRIRIRFKPVPGGRAMGGE